MKRLLVLLVVLLSSTEALIANDSLIVVENKTGKLWNPFGGVLVPLTINNPELLVDGGIGGYNSSQINFGIEVGNRFFINNSIFVGAGVRYLNYKTALRNIPKLDNGVLLLDHIVLFSRKFESFSIPITIGKNWSLNSNRKLETYVGFSAGLLKTGALRSGSNHTNTLTPTPVRWEQGISQVDADAFPAYFISNMEIGLGIQPIKQLPQLIFGLFAQMQLNSINKQQHYTTYSIDENTSTKYEMLTSYAPGKFNNIGIKLSYNF